MTKNILYALIAGLLTVAAVAIAWSLRSPPVATGPALPTFDYAAEESWAVKPALRPPAVWESGWAIDVVVLATGEALETSERIPLEMRRDDAARNLTKISAAFENIGPVYTPYLRAADTPADIASAVELYLSTENRGRAFILASDAPLPETLTTLFAANPLTKDRFGGVLLFATGDAAASPDELAEPAYCSRRHDTETPCVVPVSLHRIKGGYELRGETVLTRDLLSWLNNNASKLAEPLGALEEIEIIAIQKPPEPE